MRRLGCLLSGNEIVLTHNLGGNIDNYVVDLNMKDGNGAS